LDDRSVRLFILVLSINFPFIIFLNITGNARIITKRKPTLFLCSFHNNDNKCFVGYFWKLKKERCSHTPRPWHSWNLSHYYFKCYVSHLPNHSMTFFSLSSQIVHWSVEIQTKVYDPRKEGRIDWLSERPSEWIHVRSLNSYFAFCTIVIKTKGTVVGLVKTRCIFVARFYCNKTTSFRILQAQ